MTTWGEVLGTIPALGQRCTHCKRVRFGAGQDWHAHPEPLPCEVLVCCATCADRQHKLAVKHEKRGERWVRREARTPHPVREMTSADWDALKES